MRHQRSDNQQQRDEQGIFKQQRPVGEESSAPGAAAQGGELRRQALGFGEIVVAHPEQIAGEQGVVLAHHLDQRLAVLILVHQQAQQGVFRFQRVLIELASLLVEPLDDALFPSRPVFAAAQGGGQVIRAVAGRAQVFFRVDRRDGYLRNALVESPVLRDDVVDVGEAGQARDHHLAELRFQPRYLQAATGEIGVLLHVFGELLGGGQRAPRV